MCWRRGLRPYVLANGRYCKGHFVRPADCYLPCSQGALLHLAHRNNGCISTYTSLIYRYIINKDKYPGCSLYYLLASSNRASLPALAPSLFIGCGERPPCSCRSPHRFLALSPVCKIIAPSNFAPPRSALRLASNPSSTDACLCSRPVGRGRAFKWIYTVSQPPPPSHNVV